MGLSINAFSKLAGVSQPAASKAVKEGRLIVSLTDRTLDPNEPLNKRYLKIQLEKKKPKAEKAEKVKKERKPRLAKPLADTELPQADALPDADTLGDEKGLEVMFRDFEGTTAEDKAASIRLKLAQARRHELKLEQDKKTLIPVDLVIKAAGKLHADLKQRIQELPRRISPRILAMAASGSTELELQKALEKEIDDALESVRLSCEALSSV